MNKTVLGIFADRRNAEDALNELQDKGFNAKDISIIMKDQAEGKKLAENTGVGDVASGAVSGLTTGAILGGLTGLVGALVIPGLGAFLIGGPISAALGLTGAAAATVSGAATGAAAGGILGALMGIGLPKEDAQEYERSINQGGILVAIPARDDQAEEAAYILRQYKADQIRTISAEPMPGKRVDEYQPQTTMPSDERSFQSTPMHMFAGAKGGEAATDSTKGDVGLARADKPTRKRVARASGKAHKKRT